MYFSFNKDLNYLYYIDYYDKVHEVNTQITYNFIFEIYKYKKIKPFDRKY